MMYMKIFGSVQDNAKYYLLDDKKTVDVPWSNRYSYKNPSQDTILLGKTIGIVRIKDDDGKVVNDIQHKFDFDAVGYIAQNLEEGMTVMCQGDINYNVYEGNTQKEFNPTRIYRAKNGKDIDIEELRDTEKENKSLEARGEAFEDINLEDEGFESTFEQNAIVYGVEEDKEMTKKTNLDTFIIKTTVVGYEKLVGVKFYTHDADLAKSLQDICDEEGGAYKILLHGDIKSVSGQVDVDEEPKQKATKRYLGGENKMKKQTRRYTTELFVVGAEEDSIDSSNFSLEKLNEARKQYKKKQKAKEDYASEKIEKGNSFGKPKKQSKFEDELPEPTEWDAEVESEDNTEDVDLDDFIKEFE